MQTESASASVSPDDSSCSNNSLRKINSVQSSKTNSLECQQQQVLLSNPDESSSGRVSSRRSSPRMVIYCLVASLFSACYVTLSTRKLSAFQSHYIGATIDFMPDTPLVVKSTTNDEQGGDKDNSNNASNKFGIMSRGLKRIPPDDFRGYFNALRIASVTKEVQELSNDSDNDNDNDDGDKEQQKRPTHPILYAGCCGLGHRLIRQAAAFRAAGEMGARNLWVKWGRNCKVVIGKTRSKLDLFELLFGAGPMLTDGGANETATDLLLQSRRSTEVAKNNITILDKTKKNKLSPFVRRRYDIVNRGVRDNVTIFFQNAVPGFHYHCPGREVTKAMVLENAIWDLRFFDQLRSLFRYNDKIKYFAETKHQFSERITIGIHIRTGNGEKGDFVRKRRGIQNSDQWLVNMAKVIHQLTLRIESAAASKMKSTEGLDHHEIPYKLSPLIFVASDDKSAIEKLAAAAIPYNITTISFPQLRIESGAGVSYTKNFATSQLCLANWASQIIDASLLGATDVLIASRYSSFTQTLPLMTLLSHTVVAASEEASRDPMWATKTATEKSPLADEKENASRFGNRMFCEANLPGDGLRCYDDYIDWGLSKNVIFFPTGTRWDVNQTMPHHKETFLPCSN